MVDGGDPPWRRRITRRGSSRDVSAADAWRRAHIPPDVDDGILRPFFSGVLLEQDMTIGVDAPARDAGPWARGRSSWPPTRGRPRMNIRTIRSVNLREVALGMQRLPMQLGPAARPRTAPSAA